MELILYTADGGTAYLESDEQTIEGLMDYLNYLDNGRFLAARNQNGNKILINSRYITAIEEES